MKKNNLSILILLVFLAGCNVDTSSLSSSFDIWGNISQTNSSSLNSNSSVESSTNSSSSALSSFESSSLELSEESSSEVLTQGQYEAPSEGYALQITPSSGRAEYFVILNSIPEKDGKGREQYFGDDVILNKGDLFKMYNGTEGQSWSNIVIEEYGQYRNFLQTNNGIQVLVSGTYDIYAKLMFENDTMYIGNQEGK